MTTSHVVHLATGTQPGQPAGTPSVWMDNGRLHEEATLWLTEDVCVTSPSTATWDSAARSVVTWLDYCSVAGIDWRHALEMDFVGYRDAYLGAVSLVRGEKYSPQTVRLRMTYIHRFIDFATSEGWYSGDIKDSRTGRRRATPIDEHVLAHIAGGASAPRGRSLLPRASQDDTLRVISRQDLSQLIAWAGPRPSERAADAHHGSDRDWIALALGWALGLRVAEMRSLTIYTFESIVTDPQYPGAMHPLKIKGKGNNTRTVHVPNWLINDIHAYISGARRRAIEKRNKTSKRRLPFEGQLLVNDENDRRYPGKALGATAIDKIVERACKAKGLTRRVECTNPENGRVSVRARARYSPHCLRHTYAVMTFHNLIRSGKSETESWTHIQRQLGHRSVATTMKYYLNHTSVWSSLTSTKTLLDMLQ